MYLLRSTRVGSTRPAFRRGYTDSMSPINLPPLKAVILPKTYAHVNRDKPREYYDYKSMELNPRSLDKYQFNYKLGSGKYSEVWEACTEADPEDRYAIKVFLKNKMDIIKREAKILETLGGIKNTPKFTGVLHSSETQAFALSFPYLPAKEMRKAFKNFSDVDCRYYMFELFRALDYCHSKGIMHRDVKMSNILIIPKNRQLQLIDWGLAEFYHPGATYSVRVSTRGYKAPELLVDVKDYHYAVDMWSAGCVLASLMFRKVPFFDSSKNGEDQLRGIHKILGTDEFFKWVKKSKIKLDPEVEKAIVPCRATPWHNFVTPDNSHLVSKEGLDLLSRILCYDPSERLTPREAMGHPYFHKHRKIRESKILEQAPQPESNPAPVPETVSEPVQQ